MQATNGYTMVLQMIFFISFPHKEEQICLNSIDFKYFCFIFKYCIWKIIYNYYYFSLIFCFTFYTKIVHNCHTFSMFLFCLHCFLCKVHLLSWLNIWVHHYVQLCLINYPHLGLYLSTGLFSLVFVWYCECYGLCVFITFLYVGFIAMCGLIKDY